MSKISTYTEIIRLAEYGEQVRAALVSALEIVQNDNEQAQGIYNRITEIWEEIEDCMECIEIIENINPQIDELRALVTEISEDIETGTDTAEELTAAIETAIENLQTLQDLVDEAREMPEHFYGATYTPSVSEAGVISWTNDKEKPNPQPVSIKGAKGDTGISITSVTLNQDYTLTVTFSDGTSTTTGSIRGEKGAKGDTGKGIASVALNQDYTLTITFDDGTSTTTASIRGAQGQKGDTGATGTSISSVTLNSDYTLTIHFSDGSSTTTGSIRGAQGETGNGISSVVLNDDYTLTVNFTDGTSTTTTSIRGAQGIQGPQGDTGTTFTPSVDSSGNLSWTNDGGKANPPTVNVKGDAYVLTTQDKNDIATIVYNQLNVAEYNSF